MGVTWDVDIEAIDTAHDIYRRIKAVKSMLVQPNPRGHGEDEELPEALDDLWQFVEEKVGCFAGTYKFGFEAFLKESLRTISTEKLKSLILGSSFFRSMDCILPSVRLLQTRMVEAQVADFAPLIDLAMRLRNLIFANTSREFTKFIWAAGQLIQAFVDKCTMSVHQLQGANAAKKGPPINNAQDDEGQKWVIDVSDYLHLKCQTSLALARCQSACEALFAFLGHPWKEQAFSLVEGKKMHHQGSEQDGRCLGWQAEGNTSDESSR